MQDKTTLHTLVERQKPKNLGLERKLVHQPYTLQTWLGMVQSEGRPERRPMRETNQDRKEQAEEEPFPAVPSIQSFAEYEHNDWTKYNICALVAKCLRSRSRISTEAKKEDQGIRHVMRFRQSVQELTYSRNLVAANLEACRAGTTVDDLVSFIRLRTRLDLEQAAAVVMSTFMSEGRVDDAAALIRELSGLLCTSNMWRNQTVLSSQYDGMTSFANLSLKLANWLHRFDNVVQQPKNYNDLVPLLLRIRRVSPQTRCLQIPSWIFEKANVPEPSHHASFNRKHDVSQLKGSKYPELQPVEDSIIVSRNIFRAIQRRIIGLLAFWKPEVVYGHAVADLEDEVLYGGDRILRQLRSEDDVAKVSHLFFLFQRRLQKRVVSNHHGWPTFLAKGEGNKLYQNNIQIKSTFELALARMAGEDSYSVLNTGDVLHQIDRTCLLMQQYVVLFGDCQKSNLVFKPDVPGGSGRGPVDRYNLLCNMLAQERHVARSLGIAQIPGPCYKFLAKDIMAWNDGFKDDAFADDRVHGWEAWIRERNLGPSLEEIRNATKDVEEES